METKQCSYCKEFKSLNCFGKHKLHKDGLQSICKECKKIIDKEYRKNNHEKVLQMKKNYRENNKEKVYNQKRKCYLAKKDYYLEKTKKWRENNKEEYRIYRKKYVKERYNSDNNFKLKMLLRHRIWSALNGLNKSVRTLTLIGCSLKQLKQHLQETAINNGYKDFDINTYSGKYYHIDHIIPCSNFDLSKKKEQKICFNWRNLQILKAEENLIKGINTYKGWILNK